MKKLTNKMKTSALITALALSFAHITAMYNFVLPNIFKYTVSEDIQKVLIVIMFIFLLLPIFTKNDRFPSEFFIIWKAHFKLGLLISVITLALVIAGHGNGILADIILAFLITIVPPIFIQEYSVFFYLRKYDLEKIEPCENCSEWAEETVKVYPELDKHINHQTIADIEDFRLS